MPFNFQKLDNVRIALALLAAVLTGGAALYGVYTKAQDARDATAAGYETLAPEINRLKQAVSRLEAENLELRQALRSPGQPPAPRPEGGTVGRVGARRPRVTPPRPPDGTDPNGTRASGGSSPSPTSPPAAPAPAPASTPAPPTAPPAQPAPPGGVLGDLEKRVPIDFEKAVEIWKEVRNLPRRP